MNETKKVLSDQEKVKSLISHDGWPILEQKFMAQIKELQSISSIKGSNATEKMRSLAANEKAVEMMLTWFDSVVGLAEQHDLIESTKRESFIHRD